MKALATSILLLIVPITSCKSAAAPSSGKKNEAHYRDQWAARHDGETEVSLPDGTRCDVLTATHAIEVEWAHKWYEGFGQALWYGFQTNKKPGIVLILRSEKDRKFVIRIQSLAAHHGISLKVWTVPL